uniref:Uncharacterized protein n=1 Tax=Proboscia inermis TaxID=420281 RepID=A0A6T8K862_9STRA
MSANSQDSILLNSTPLRSGTISPCRSHLYQRNRRNSTINLHHLASDSTCIQEQHGSATQSKHHQKIFWFENSGHTQYSRNLSIDKLRNAVFQKFYKNFEA